MQEGCPTISKIERQRTAEGKLLNEYLILKRIGEGPYAKIKLARNTKTNELVAIKKFSLYLLKKKTKQVKMPDGTFRHVSIVEDVLRELKIARSLHNPNVCQLREVLDDQQKEKLYLVMQYCQKGELATWNHKKHCFQVRKELLEESVLRRVCIGVIKGLQYLHEQLVMHRDIKPANILLDQDCEPRFIDFGRAVRLNASGDKLKGSQGTYHFMAPEMLHQYDKSGYDPVLCDIWSLGVTFYCLACRQLPFDGDPILRLFEAIEAGKYSYPETLNVPPFLRQLIDRCLVRSPKERAQLTQLLTLLTE